MERDGVSKFIIKYPHHKNHIVALSLTSNFIPVNTLVANASNLSAYTSLLDGGI